MPGRLRQPQEQLCPFIALSCSVLTQGRGFISSRGANPRNKGSRFEGWFLLHPQACWKWLILPLIRSSSYFNVLPPYWCRFGRWSLWEQQNFICYSLCLSYVYILIILCAKSVFQATLFREIICKEVFYFIFTNATAAC